MSEPLHGLDEECRCCDFFRNTLEAERGRRCCGEATSTDVEKWLAERDARVQREERERVAGFLREHNATIAEYAKNEWAAVSLCEFLARALADAEKTKGGTK